MFTENIVSLNFRKLALMACADCDKKNIKFGIILSYVSLAVSVVGSFLVTRKVLDYIGDYQYGLYSFVLSIVNWATVVSNALNASYVRFATVEAVKSDNGDVGKINTLYMKLLAIISLLILIIGLAVFGGLYISKVTLFAYNWEDSSKLYVLFFISLINVFLTISTNLFSLFVNYKKKFIFSRLFSLFISIFGFVAHWLLAYMTKSVISIAICSIATTLISSIGNFIFIRKRLNFCFQKTKLKENIPLLKQIVIFSGIILFNTIVDQINASVDQIILGAAGMAENVTIYKIGQSLTSYFLIMSTSISSSYVPTINELVINEKNDEINALYLKISRLQTIVLCTISFGFLSCGYDFVRIWLDDSRIDVYYVAVALMLLNICPLSINSSIEIQRARNKHLFRALVYFFVAIFNVALSLLFLHFFPKDKAIYACLLGTIISTIISHWIIMNIYNAKIMKLPVLRQIIMMLVHMLAGFICYEIINLIFMIPAAKSIANIVLLFFIKGFLFVVLYCFCLIALNWKIIKPKIDSIKAKRCNRHKKG